MNLRRALPLLAVLPALAFAQPRNDHRGPRVVLFEHPNFQGGAIVLRPGEAIDNLARVNFDDGRRANDRITSILVEGGADVTVYTDAYFRGDALRVTDDLRDLSRGDHRVIRFNDRISSIRVDFRRGPERPPGRGHDDDRDHDRPPRIDPDKIVRRAYQDILEREPDESGLRHFRSMIVDRGWSEKQVRDSLRASDEYRVTYMTARLNRVYREVLGRDVDPRGFEHYRNKIIEHDWSDDDIRRDLRNSEEYRNRPRS
ncbi:MAG: hypothetical protein HYV96_08725 [Opitutae bacterium]|nr:hypothetical protein [Opitutae bacterium]